MLIAERRRAPRALVRLFVSLSVAASVVTSPAPVGAQRTPAVRAYEPDSLPLIGSMAEDRARLRQLRGDSTTGFLQRSLSSRVARALPAPQAGAADWTILAPEVYVVDNSALPFSQNDGLLWAGRGRSLRVRGGLANSFGRLRLVLMPEYAAAANDSFVDVDTQIEHWYRPALDLERFSKHASPWNMYPTSADVPVRFGDHRYRQATLGQSALWYEGGAVAAGVATENLWWGPGIHDALIMTNNAAGVPHAFVRTARPLHTAVGDFEGTLVVGSLAESDFYDLDHENDARALSAGVVSYRPHWAPDLTVGVARAVYAPVPGTGAAFGHVLDVFGAFHRPGARAETDSAFTGGRDQLTSLFARWVFPSRGVEVYGEVGSDERPASFRDFLIDPAHGRAYVLGGQGTRALRGGELRAQVEFAQMEQGSSYRHRPTTSWYTSRAVPQGYTQKGQVIGATIGPGSSHQWVAADYLAPSWSVGAFAGRWRLNTDGMYAAIDFPAGTGLCEFDTTLYPGARGSILSTLVGLVQVEYIWGTRLNAFHQNNSGCPAPETGRHLRDVRNATWRVTIAPRIAR